MRFFRFIMAGFFLFFSCTILCIGIADSNQSSGLFGSYVINTEPNGADVYIQGIYNGKTPLLFIPDGQIDAPWTIHLQKDGYQNNTSIISENVKPGTQKEILVLLIPVSKFGTIAVSAQPEGSLARLDGNASIPLPYIFPSVPEGIHTLQVSKSGYKSYLNDQVSVEAHGKTTIQVTLIPNYQRKELVVTSTPPDAEILVDGIFRGTTSRDIPLMIGPLNDGQHTILGRITGYQDKKLTASTRQDLSTNVHLTMVPVNMVPTSATLKIRSTPSEADVLLNGIWFGEVPTQGYLLLADVPPNRYKVTISHEGYEHFIEWVFPGEGETVTIDAMLRPIPK